MNADGDDQGVDPSPGASATITTMGATGVVGAGASTDSSAVPPDTPPHDHSAMPPEGSAASNGHELAPAVAPVSPGDKMHKTYELTLSDLDDNTNYKWTVPKQEGRDVAQALINTKVLSVDKIRRVLVIC